ncbi:MAG TPA: hypothetical protein VN626_06375 [Clostridia bacterium]|nr:hypothetical protein [Clostridia bacterium]
MIHDTELLQYVYKTADMGCTGIQSVLDYTQSAPLKDKLKDQYKEYSDLRKQAQTLLQVRQEPPAGADILAKVSTDFMAAGKMMVDHSDSKIAEMTIQGNQMGVNKTIKHLHDYSGQNDSARALAEKLLATEQANAEQLKSFL